MPAAPSHPPAPDADDPGAHAAADGPAEGTRAPTTPGRRGIEWIVVITGAVVVALLVRTFVLQTFWIPSASMSSTIVEDDRVLVNKLAYRVGDVGRGDVVVFRRPSELLPSGPEVLIKRVIALGGQVVSIRDDRVRVDGRLLDEPYVHGLPTTPQVGCPVAPPTDGIETVGGFRVPPGAVLVLGDNRTDSTDGRCFGPIDTSSIIGRAEAVFWPPSHARRL